MPVAPSGKFLLNDVPYKKDLASAQQVGDDEGGQRRHEDHGYAADNPRNT